MFPRLSQMLRFLRILCVVVVVVCLAGCGGGAGDDAVVRIGGSSISRATVDHWTTIQGIISDGVPSRWPVPKGLVPDPPRYTACIGYLRARDAATGHGGETAAALKRECRQRYEAARRRVLGILITYQWLLGESKAQQMTVSDEEVAKEVARYSHNFQSDAAFRAYVRNQGKSLADESLILENDLLFRRLEQKVVVRDGAAGAVSFFRSLVRRWAAKTSCSVGYVVPDCRQYKGSGVPELMA